MNTPRVPLALLALALGPLAGCGGGSAEARNVVLITLDTTRPDFFGAWGQPGDPTPHFDALAEDGVRFATAVSSSAVTPVSHASILTGRAPYGHGLRILAGVSGFRLPADVPTLATVLKTRGYTTAAFHSAFPVSSVYAFDRGFDEFEDLTASGLEETQGGGMKWDVPKGQRRSDTTNGYVLNFLERVESPFFLWVHYWDPHDPYILPPSDFMKERGVPFDGEGKSIESRERYGAEVSYLDAQFGILVDLLKEEGRYDDTIIAVVADHGEGLDDGLARHGWFAHRILYQEQIHVPLIVRVPGTPSGLTVENLVRAVDIFPTVLDYLDIAPPGELEGRSLRTLIEGTPDEPRVAYADQINLWDANARMIERRPKADLLHALMDDEWKLIYRPSHPMQSELYAYREDPGEENNLFRDRKDVASRMMQELAERNGWVLRPFTPDGGQGMSERDRELLNKLGYGEGGANVSLEVLADMWGWICPEELVIKPLKSAGACPDCGAACLPVRKKKP